MPERESHNGLVQRENRQLRQLEIEILVRFSALKETQRKIAACRKYLDATTAAYERANPMPGQYSEEWYCVREQDQESNRAMGAWKDSMKAFQDAVIATMEYQRSIADATRVKDGNYETSVMFVGRDGKEETLTMRPFQMKSSTLAGVISRAQADISMEGIHNSGFRVPSESYMGSQVKYTIRGPDGFEYSSLCLVDQGGQILQSAWQFR